MRGWMRHAVPIGGALAATIVQRLRPRPTPAGTAASHLRSILERLPRQNGIQAGVYAPGDGLPEHASEVR
jgi:hypothetical protein